MVVAVVGVADGAGFRSGLADEVAAVVDEGAVLDDAGAGHRDVRELVGPFVGVVCDGPCAGTAGGRVGLVDDRQVAECVQDVGFPDAGGVGGRDAAIRHGRGELAARSVVNVLSPDFGFAGPIASRP